jgi:hypothetical protein
VLLVPLLFAACGPDAVGEGVGACELQYTETVAYDDPIVFCVHEHVDTCTWVQAFHGVTELGFWVQESCAEVGFPVCCETGDLDSWFEDLPQADAARQYVEGGDCVPCDPGMERSEGEITREHGLGR